MCVGKPDDRGAVRRVYQRDGKATLSDLFYHVTKCAKLSFREVAVFSVCVGKVGHHAFDVEGTSQERIVEERQQLFRGKSKTPHPCFDLEMNRVGDRM